jgi:hypothetical protein
MVFVSFRIFFRITRELEYIFFLSREGRILFPEFNIRLYDKNSESDFFSLLYSKRAGVRFLNLPSCMPCGLLGNDHLT